jgi:protein tyrosine/serine phosphatase
MKVSSLLLTSFAVLSASCSTMQPQISVACEENDVGNSVMKWETTPTIDGKIKIYASTDPNYTPSGDSPIAEASIGDQKVTIVTNNPSIRFYYTIIFNDEFPVTVATRNINVAGVQNVRDIGGYPISKYKKTAWGKIYRSAEIDDIEPAGIKVLQGLGIRTIIDLRSEGESHVRYNSFRNVRFIHVPMYTDAMLSTIEQVYKGAIPKDSISQVIEQINTDIAMKHPRIYRKLFKALLDKSNYPILIECSDGKSRTGIATAIILGALGVNYDFIMQDYQLSNLYFDVTKVSRGAYKMSESTQEAITSLFSAKSDYLDAAYERIIEEYGDIDRYLHKAVGLSKKEINQLKQMLIKDNTPH